MRKLLLVAASLLALPGGAFAQAVSTQQSATRVEAATAVAFAQAAVAAVSTATITVPAGLFAYITAISMDACADGTGGTAETNANFTTTNIQSTPKWSFSWAGTANTCATPIREWFTTPLKSAQAGTNVTVVSPSDGGGTHNQYTIRVYYYLAP